MKHSLPSSFADNEVKIALVGCGGNGTQMLTGLARMHVALRSFGHPGFKVTVFDPDRVSEANIGRQLFSYADVGQFKASLLVHRLNIFFGLDWVAQPENFPNEAAQKHRREYEAFDIIIGCVDSAKSRREIHSYGRQFLSSGSATEFRAMYWLDVGNLSNTGQVILGQFKPEFSRNHTAPGRLIDALAPTIGKKDRNRKKGSKEWKEWYQSILPTHLPNVTDLFPSIMDASVPEVDIPSCSLAEALESQDLFVNQAVTTFGLQLLWMFFRQGGIDHHGYFINLATGKVTPLPICKDTWERFNPAIVGK